MSGPATQVHSPLDAILLKALNHALDSYQGVLAEFLLISFGQMARSQCKFEVAQYNRAGNGSGAGAMVELA